MAETKKSSKGGLTRGKAILIGVLSVVLVVIVYIQFGGSSSGKPEGGESKYRPPRPAVVVQPANEAPKPVTLAAAKPAPNGTTSKDKNAVAVSVIDESRWKSPEVTSVVAYDPFALPPAFPQPPKLILGAKGAESLIAAATADDAKKQAEIQERLRSQLLEMKQRGVNMIVSDGSGDVAVIDDRLVHVGDKIDGFTVTAIDPDGYVHIEKKDSP